MNIAIVGTVYVGLVTGTCLASIGHKVICVDIDERKINNLNNGIIPIYEPGLTELIEKYKENISFTTSLSSILNTVDIAFCAVGTPMDEDGSADLQYVLNVAEEFAKSIDKYTIFVTKSTVPVNTHIKVKNRINKIFNESNKSVEYDIVSNPEFLKEGTAIDDFINPDRIVIGYESSKAKEYMHKIYERYSDKIFYTDLPTAEMIKYAANSMLATRISFINEFVTIRYVFTRDVIPDEYVALFICNRDIISKNPISEITTPNYLGKLKELYSVDSNLAKYISALFYQINPEDALDVVYVNRLRDELERNNSNLLNELKSRSFFDSILDKVIPEVNFNYIPNVILCLDKNCKDVDSSILKKHYEFFVATYKILEDSLQEYQKVLLSHLEGEIKYVYSRR